MTFRDINKEIRINSEKRSKVLIFLFRTSNLLVSKKFFISKIFGKLLGSGYAFYSGWILGLDLPYKTKIGKGLQIYHGFGIVVHSSAIIGRNVILRQNTTIGQAHSNGECPTIGNNVDIGAHSIIIGNICIGNNCTIGAGSLVNKSFPADSIIAGNPAKFIRQKIQ